MRLDAAQFLTELHKLYERRKESGSIFVTMKRTNEKPRKSKADHSAAELRCLVRATDGKRRISTALAPRELPRFREEYATILRAHADALKKRERRAKKAAAE